MDRNLLFLYEAELNKEFTERTMVLPNIGTSTDQIKNLLLDPTWIVLNGERGTGKTSFLLYAKKELSKKEDLLASYIAFDSADVKEEVGDDQSKIKKFLILHLYRNIITSLGNEIQKRNSTNKLKEKEGDILFKELLSSLYKTESIQHITTQMKKAGLFGALGGTTPMSDLQISWGKKLDDIIIKVSNHISEPDFNKFRETLVKVLDLYGISGFYLLIDEINEQRLTQSQQKALFDHLYNQYRSIKNKVVLKLASTSAVAIPDFVFEGRYFFPWDLGSYLLYMVEYEELVKNIFNTRLRELGESDKSHLDYFTEQAFHELVLSSMGNVREFFYNAKSAFKENLDKVGQPEINDVIRKAGTNIENEINKIGRNTLKIYQRIVNQLKEKSDAKNDIDKPVGVSYFLISDFDELDDSERGILETLENKKAIFGTSEWRAHRKKGQKSELYVLSYPVCIIRSIRWLDLVRLYKENKETELNSINKHRVQLNLKK